MKMSCYYGGSKKGNLIWFSEKMSHSSALTIRTIIAASSLSLCQSVASILLLTLLATSAKLPCPAEQLKQSFFIDCWPIGRKCCTKRHSMNNRRFCYPQSPDGLYIWKASAPARKLDVAAENCTNLCERVSLK